MCSLQVHPGLPNYGASLIFVLHGSIVGFVQQSRDWALLKSEGGFTAVAKTHADTQTFFFPFTEAYRNHYP